jgi:hypothetical protein
VQWLAPLASEAPEFIVALLFVWRGQAAAGMRTLVSSKVNQWTLLIATLPLVFSLGAGSLGGMPLVERQQHELWLTAAQSLFAVVLISGFAMSRWEAVALLVPFVAQLILPPSIAGVDVRMAFTVGYLVVGFGLLLDPRRRQSIRCWPRHIGEALRRHHAPQDASTLRPAGPPTNRDSLGAKEVLKQGVNLNARGGDETCECTPRAAGQMGQHHRNELHEVLSNRQTRHGAGGAYAGSYSARADVHSQAVVPWGH